MQCYLEQFVSRVNNFAKTDNLTLHAILTGGDESHMTNVANGRDFFLK